ncbi:dolichyl pyrophosphate Man9GlcNAc2 alpha-1,3-glucosyltransferase [Octopus bimaculoides]|uniref:dolichyl pyrophosphate Man9GlcNAc2 alpha-1,3-glucosyltransferase n=1 Tax=Octopus bimaculoides TaxID=37653 RepID=UPI00071DC825|nr:dolichyl pyrophosphate Man9GlcNAc2 alpha-1,3-glucosyltransferase [Octopus bimaculoides]|eukprot:XP_014780541.1 PREDICTED: dolichyl pyrophosphate Man9GlcNAc2 alpha-1,3-glucosyltransferase-like [Octopus bimaculoides]
MTTKTSSAAPICEFLFVIVCAVLVRWFISLGGYSGAGKPPMFGDFEAQRHWMEITYNLPVKKWYHNSTDNDLMYWGLDYPPLTAYHSWIMGAISHYINPDWVALHSSRGLENPLHKLFMRYSVIFSDLLLYIPAVCLFMYHSYRKDSKKCLLSTACALIYPGLILIDHGHFQYNCVSLGLALWGILALAQDKDVLGAVAFILALCYKQMELYHSWPFFCYLLGKCIFNKKENRFLKLVRLSVAVLGTFSLCFLPFFKQKGSIFQVLHRLFPFERGLYEDKVANFWCSISIFVKLKDMFPQKSLIYLCLSVTAVCLLPSGLNLLSRPALSRFKLTLASSSLIFFLFSYQVHEKSILLVALPFCLLLPNYPFLSFWFLHISTLSMFPLLVKDGLILQYFSCQALFALVVLMLYKIMPDQVSKKRSNLLFNWLLRCMMLLSVSIGLALSIVSLVVEPPNDKPDLFAVFIAVYCCGHFLMFLICLHYIQFTLDRPRSNPVKSNSSPRKNGPPERKKASEGHKKIKKH